MQQHQSIIDLCKKNNPKAQMQLYRLYCKAMFLVANRYVNDTMLAEDVMQEAFIKAFQKIDTYKNEVSFGAWLKKIVINKSIDALKKQKLETITINNETLRVIDDHEDDWNVDASLNIETIINTINSLKEKYKIILNLYLIEGYDHEEIASILNIEANISRTHLSRGKRMLQEKLKATNYATRY